MPGANDWDYWQNRQTVTSPNADELSGMLYETTLMPKSIGGICGVYHYDGDEVKLPMFVFNQGGQIRVVDVSLN